MKKKLRPSKKLSLKFETIAALDISGVRGGDGDVDPIDPNNSALCSSPGQGTRCLVSVLMPCLTHDG